MFAIYNKSYVAKVGRHVNGIDTCSRAHWQHIDSHMLMITIYRRNAFTSKTIFTRAFKEGKIWNIWKYQQWWAKKDLHIGYIWKYMYMQQLHRLWSDFVNLCCKPMLHAKHYVTWKFSGQDIRFLEKTYNFMK